MDEATERAMVAIREWLHRAGVEADLLDDRAACSALAWRPVWFEVGNGHLAGHTYDVGLYSQGTSRGVSLHIRFGMTTHELSVRWPLHLVHPRHYRLPIDEPPRAGNVQVGEDLIPAVGRAATELAAAVGESLPGAVRVLGYSLSGALAAATPNRRARRAAASADPRSASRSRG